MRNFNTLFKELATARSHYEDLRRTDATFADRLEARQHLDDLRIQMGAVRRYWTSF